MVQGSVIKCVFHEIYFQVFFSATGSTGKNKPFPNCFMPRDESEAWCTTFHMKMSFHSNANKTHFHVIGCASSIPFLQGPGSFLFLHLFAVNVT